MPSVSSYPRLLGDIGGTHARFAWQSEPGAPLTHLRTMDSRGGLTLADVIRGWVAEGPAQAPREACLGVATAIKGDHVALTNHRWQFSIEALRQQLGLQRLLVVNDFTALALALPGLSTTDRLQIGGGQADALAPVALIGPGTGLGVSGLLRGAGGFVPISGEGGHVSLSARTDLEWEVIAQLARQHGHVSAERVLSGPGLLGLYRALCAVRGCLPLASSDPADISCRALSGKDPHCLSAVQMFFDFLGTVAGDLALTLGARGGVYIGGGIVPRMVDAFQASGFRRRFEDKGRFADYLREVPVWLIVASESPALWGAARALDLAHQPRPVR